MDPIRYFEVMRKELGYVAYLNATFSRDYKEWKVYEGDGHELDYDLDVYFVQSELEKCVERVLGNN